MRVVVLLFAVLCGCPAPVSEPFTPDTGGAADLGTDSELTVVDAAMDAAIPHDLGNDTGDTAVEPDLAGRPWRSALYPADWAPGFADSEGRTLHDFSYAGYHNGDDEPVAPSGPVFDVATYGADGSGAADSHAAFQSAIAAASTAGGVVVVPSGLYRLDDRLTISASNVVLKGEGAAVSKLWFTRFDQMAYQSHIAFEGSLSTVTEQPLAADGAQGAVTVNVADAAAFGVGDDVVIGWTITEAFIAEHGMTGVWQAFNDTWQPFFRRQVVAVDAAAQTVELDLPLRYPAKMRDGASLRLEAGYLTEVGVEDIGVADAVGWAEAWSQNQVHVIELDGVKDGWIRGVESFPSPGAPGSGPGAGAHLQNGGVIVRSAKRVTVADSRLEEAQNRGGGGCGYLFEVRQSSEVLFADLIARAGRHNFIQNWGFGASGIVWLRVHSSEGRTFLNIDATVSGTGDSEFHHSLAMANLIDSSTFEDGFAALNRKDYSTGAGHTATQTVFWNTSGAGRLRSYQYGHGYVIGTAPGLAVLNDLPGQPQTAEERAQLEDLGPWTGTWPIDWVEGLGRAGELQPPSLYEDQLRRRR